MRGSNGNLCFNNKERWTDTTFINPVISHNVRLAKFD